MQRKVTVNDKLQAERKIQKIKCNVYAISAVIEMNIIMYCGIKKADRCCAVPVPL